ncbi:MAG: Uma2 family endonuclease, partial [bacterium]
IMVPAPNTSHQTISGILEFELRKFIEKHAIGKIFDAPIDVILSETNVVQPDILFITNENSEIITNKNIDGAPELIIEILSPSTGYYDLIEKKEIYEKFGVQEYWILDPKKQWVEIYVNVQNKFKLHQRAEKKGILKSSILDGFQISLEKIFETE